MKIAPKNIDEYISTFPVSTQVHLNKIRTLIKRIVPEAIEKMSYAMPTFYLEGNLVHFAAYKHHIGFYPAPSGIIQFQKEVSVYPFSKGAIQFPLDKPIPLKLIEKIVKFRAKENKEKALEKSKRTCKKGHTFYKSSSCPVCPICEKLKIPQQGFLSLLAAPARRALENKGIKTLKSLSTYSEKEILLLHGMGKSTIPILKKVLKDSKLGFRK
ncbi:MAG: DUF1801 domain-containing protein [Bacteroidetes bacterium]|nr:DUF1801 domain-containing protein [Bacteroidota bacterium]